MEDRRRLQAAPASLAIATVVRQFAGSRVERQIVARVFDLAWLSSGTAPPQSAGDDGSDAPASFQASKANAVLAEGVSP